MGRRGNPFPLLSLRKGTDCHNQSVDWFRNDSFYNFVILQKIHTCLLTILTKMVECSLANIPDNFIPYQEWRRERPNEATATCFSRCQIRR